MEERTIDAIQVQLLIEEIRYNPADATPEVLELIELYELQQKLIEQWNKQSH